MQEYFDYNGFEEISAEFIEKKKISRSANSCGLGLMALLGVMYFWSLVYVRIAAFLNIDFKQAVNLIEEPFFSQLLSIVISFFMVVVPFFIVAKANGIRIMNEISFKKAERGTFLPCFLLGVGFCLFSSFATSIGAGVFSSFGIEFPSSSPTYPEGFFGLMISLLSTAFFPAFFEELALRGFVLSLLKKHSQTFSIVASSVVFAFMHANFSQIVFAFLVGLVLGFVTIKTGSIWTAVAIHFTNNVISVGVSYLPFNNDFAVSFILLCVFVFVLIFAIWAVNTLQKQEGGFFKLEGDTKISASKKIVWFLTSPAIIIGIIISLLIAFFAR